jgi:hypothetical protein
VEQPVKVETKAKVETKPVAEDVDEEEMYGQSVKLEGQTKIDDHDAIDTKPKHDVSDTIFIFRDDEILIHDYRHTSGWFVGDVQNSMRVPEFCHITKVDALEHKTDTIDGIISGGFMHESAQMCVYGFSLEVEQVNTVETINCHMHTFLPMLSTARFMHQSCIVRGKSGYWSLLIIGGKQNKSNWLNSVETLDLLPFFRPGTMKKEDGKFVPATSEW